MKCKFNLFDTPRLHIYQVIIYKEGSQFIKARDTESEVSKALLLLTTVCDYKTTVLAYKLN